MQGGWTYSSLPDGKRVWNQHKAAKPAEKTMSNEKISFTCLFPKI